MKKNIIKKEKVAVAMSGGVDSSVSALLLKEQGYSVTGFFIKFWSEPECGIKRENSCCDSESLKKTKEVAKKIGIPFHVVDAQKIFKKTVVDYFIDGYKKLETPNPCVLCNKLIKFGWFLNFAEKLGFGKIATGHYVQIKKDENGIFHLFQGKDDAKDQSYFLCRLNQKQLKKIIFPVGNMVKEEVKKIAGKNKLLFENKKESQEICFIRNGSYREFLKRQLPEKYFHVGNILDMKNKKIGEHQGLLNYTIGQRKGIEQKGIKNENKRPLYVVDFKKKENNLIVGSEMEILRKNLRLNDIHWISEATQKKALKKGKMSVKIRYRSQKANCIIKFSKRNKSEAEIFFGKSQKAVTPGQFAVFYAGREVLGSGVIE
jgi:tRNA-uridine 2-sulfurtransferase